MPVITLPDGSKREFADVVSVMQVAEAEAPVHVHRLSGIGWHSAQGIAYGRIFW